LYLVHSSPRRSVSGARSSSSARSGYAGNTQSRSSALRLETRPRCPAIFMDCGAAPGHGNLRRLLIFLETGQGLDLLVASEYTSEILAMLGNGDGTFQASVTQSMWPSATSTGTAGPTWPWPVLATSISVTAASLCCLAG